MKDVYLVMHNLLNGVGLILVAFLLYLFVYYVRKFYLEHWIDKAVNAAEIMLYDADSAEKKAWVLSFLKDNGLTTGVSDEVVNTLIEASVNSLNLKQGSAPKKTKRTKTKLVE